MKKKTAQLQPEKGGRSCQKKIFTDPKIREGEAGDAPSMRAEVPLQPGVQPMVQTTLEQGDGLKGL